MRGRRGLHRRALPAESGCRRRGTVGSSATGRRSVRGEELVAVELRDALDQLGAVVGAVYTDDILARIFSRFCIGK